MMYPRYPMTPGVDYYERSGEGVQKFPAERRHPADPARFVAQCETEEGADGLADYLNQCVRAQAADQDGLETAAEYMGERS